MRVRGAIERGTHRDRVIPVLGFTGAYGMEN